MSRINSNVPSLTAQRFLQLSQKSLSKSLERLSSGLRINRGADDPAGLIVSERLRAEISSINQAVKNSARAINVIATTEAALDSVSNLLTDIQALVVEAANSGAFSPEEIEANQLQIDASIDSITRIANTSEFAGRKLLNGELDYVVSGVDGARLADVKVLGTRFGSRAFVPVDVNVSQSAQLAELRYAPSAIGATAVTVDIAGKDGIVTLSFPANATSNDIVTAINSRSDDTGVSAAFINTTAASGVAISSKEYGSKAFVSVTEIGSVGNFKTLDRADGTTPRTKGRDATATVNGVATVADGLKLKISDGTLAVQMILDEAYGNGSNVSGVGTSLGASSFAVVEGGALFQLGPEVTPNLQENIGVAAVQANKLGNSIVGFLSELKSGQRYALNTDSFVKASKVVEETITQIAVLRGRLGAFERDTLQPNIGQLQITAENLTSSQAVIRDTDFAVETSELTRAQILVQAGNSILAIANAQSQNVLQLLGG